MTRPRNLIVLAEPPAVGLVIAISDQRYELIGHEPRYAQDGTATTWLVWQAPCAFCGQRFLARSKGCRWPEVRRCKPHRAPGNPVPHDPEQQEADHGR